MGGWKSGTYDGGIHKQQGQHTGSQGVRLNVVQSLRGLHVIMPRPCAARRTELFTRSLPGLRATASTDTARLHSLHGCLHVDIYLCVQTPEQPHSCTWIAEITTSTATQTRWTETEGMLSSRLTRLIHTSGRTTFAMHSCMRTERPEHSSLYAL